MLDIGKPGIISWKNQEDHFNKRGDWGYAYGHPEYSESRRNGYGQAESG